MSAERIADNDFYSEEELAYFAQLEGEHLDADFEDWLDSLDESDEEWINDFAESCGENDFEGGDDFDDAPW